MEHISSEEAMSGYTFQTMDKQRTQDEKQKKLEDRIEQLEKEVTDLKDRLQSTLDTNSLWDGR